MHERHRLLETKAMINAIFISVCHWALWSPIPEMSRKLESAIIIYPVLFRRLLHVIRIIKTKSQRGRARTRADLNVAVNSDGDIFFQELLFVRRCLPFHRQKATRFGKQDHHQRLAYISQIAREVD